jgi:hypothetical protein
MFWTP